MKHCTLLEKLNNVRIRNKLLMVYVFCLVIPIGVVYLFLFMSIWENVIAQKIFALDLSMDRIRLQVATEIEQCVRINEMINVNQRLNEALDVVYDSPAAYIEEFKSYLGNELDYYRIGFRQIDEITVYVENKTIINGGNFAYLSMESKNGEIYKNLCDSGNYLSLVTYNDSNGNEIISLIGKNYFYPGEFPKFTKIDLNTDMLNWLARSEQLTGNVYLFNGENECIMQYVTDNSISPQNIENQGKNFLKIEKSFGDEGLMTGWRLIGIFSNQDQWDTFFSTGGRTMLISVIFFLLGTVVIIIISRSIVQRLNGVSSYLRSSAAAKHEPLTIAPGKDEIGTMIFELNRGTVRTRQLIDMVYKRELEKARAELHALQSQIQPHFLYNTLNSIRLKCLLDGSPDAANMLKRLAVLLRRTIGWQDEMVSLQDEVNAIVDFLEIQKFRYMDKLTYHIQVDPQVTACRIPKLILQPLVENASFHGIELSEKSGCIRVSIRPYKNGIRVIVRDNGVGIPSEKLKLIESTLTENAGALSENIGLQNVYRRLRYYYGDKMLMRVISVEGKGTAVVLMLGSDVRSSIL